VADDHRAEGGNPEKVDIAAAFGRGLIRQSLGALQQAHPATPSGTHRLRKPTPFPVAGMAPGAVVDSVRLGDTSSSCTSHTPLSPVDGA
jgi:hypothetical protein